MKKRTILSSLLLGTFGFNGNSEEGKKDLYKTNGYNTGFKKKPHYKLNGRHHGQRVKN